MQFRLVDVYTSKPTEAGLMVQQEGKTYVSIFNTGPSAALTAYQPYQFQYKSTALKHVDVKVPATLANAVNIIGVPQAAIADDAFGWVQIYGEAECLVDGTTDVAAGEYLEVINAGVAAIKEGTAISKGSFAVAIDAVTADAATQATVFLTGLQVEIAAS